MYTAHGTSHGLTKLGRGQGAGIASGQIIDRGSVSFVSSSQLRVSSTDVEPQNKSPN